MGCKTLFPMHRNCEWVKGSTPLRKIENWIIIRREEWMLRGETAVHDVLPGLGLSSLENKRKLFFYPHDFESLWTSMLILNYLIICLYYGMKLFWSVYSTFLSQLYFFCILGFYSKFQPAPLSEID